MVPAATEATRTPAVTEAVAPTESVAVIVTSRYSPLVKNCNEMFLPEIPLIDAVPAPEESKVIAALYAYGAVPPVASNETSVPVVVPAAMAKSAGGARLREGRLSEATRIDAALTLFDEVNAFPMPAKTLLDS
jgi:hypothetical protein